MIFHIAVMCRLSKMGDQKYTNPLQITYDTTFGNYELLKEKYTSPIQELQLVITTTVLGRKKMQERLWFAELQGTRQAAILNGPIHFL